MSNSLRILIVDDDSSIRRSLGLTLQTEGYRTRICESATEALRVYQESIQTEDPFALGLFDIRMHEISGLELYEKLLGMGADFKVIFMSGHASLSEAAQTIKLGAFDFIEKPFVTERLLITVERATQAFTSEQKIKRLEAKNLDQLPSDQRLIGKSEILLAIKQQAQKIALTTTTVFIGGESGTGKELLAQSIHDQSKRSNRPFIKVNCAAIPDSLLESEFFGHEKGAFTGAVSSKRGYFEQAHHGTLFLDEIAELSAAAQAKILRVLQSSEIQKVGSEKLIKVNVRIIAASHRDLKKECELGKFREDLYFRISVVPLELPPLRARKEDIPELAAEFLRQICIKNGLPNRILSEPVVQALVQYDWPGNVRELHNCIERVSIFSGALIGLSDLPDFVRFPQNKANNDSGFDLTWDQFCKKSERAFIVEHLKRAHGNISQAALNMDFERSALHKKITTLKIEKREYF